jgi:hypothetical protein
MLPTMTKKRPNPAKAKAKAKAGPKDLHGRKK